MTLQQKTVFLGPNPPKHDAEILRIVEQRGKQLGTHATVGGHSHRFDPVPVL